jgi:acyl-CoA synthetase (NDP forming)
MSDTQPCVKVGFTMDFRNVAHRPRTDVGRSWALSHTGRLAGSDEIVSAVLRQYGVTRVEGLDELLDTAAMLARSAQPAAAGACVYSISGGTSAHMADSPMSDKFVADLIAVAETTGKPICVVWGSPVGTEEAYREGLLSSSRVVTFRTFRNCVTAVRAYLDFHAFQRRVGDVLVPPGPSAADGPGGSAQQGTAGRARTAGRTLTEPAAKRLLARYGIPVTRDVLARTPDEAVAAAAAIGPPVVLKAVSAAIAHKSDLGLVRTGIQAPEQVRATFGQLEAGVAAVPGAELEGVLVCEQAAGGSRWWPASPPTSCSGRW